jgi:Tol biopolymer transport system component
MTQALTTRIAALVVTLTVAGCAGAAPTQAPPSPTPSVAVIAEPTLAATPAATATAVPSATAAFGEPTGRILFSAVTPTEAMGSIFVIPADGSGDPGRLHQGYDPDWSPDGTEIAFIDDDGIWVMRGDGTQAKSIRHDAAMFHHWPVWSPDGAQIAFIEAPTCAPCAIGIPWALSVMNPDGSGVRKVAEPWSPDRPAWSLDGQTLVFAGEWLDPPTAANGLQSIHLDGTGQRQFAKEHDSYPSWSPDGRFAVLRDVGTTKDGFDRGLFIANVDGSAPHALTLPLIIGEGLAWSPDGGWLAFQGTASPTIGATTQWDLWIVRPDGTDLRNLTNSTDLQEGFPAWD